MPKVLKYKGPGYFDGVPAGDLTDDDVRNLPPEWTADKLTESGKYARMGGSVDALAEADRDHIQAVKATAPPKRGG